MSALPVLQQCRYVPVCLSNEDLPNFYMEDYSVLGLLVTNLDRACRVLVHKNYAVCKKSDHLKVEFDGVDQISEIIDLLIQNGIDCGIADIVDQVYQG